MLLVGLPAYNSMVHIDVMHTILNLKIPYTLVTIGNESLVTRARNKIFSIFMKFEQFDKLFFIDADIKMNPQDIKKLYESKYDIIGAPVRLKDLSRVVWNYGDVLKKYGETLVSTNRLGTAAMMINRKVGNKLKDWAVENNYYFKDDPFYSRGTAVEDLTIYDVFQTGIYDGEYLSEDYFFCKKCLELGFEIIVDTSIQTIHNGMLPLF